MAVVQCINAQRDLRRIIAHLDEIAPRDKQRLFYRGRAAGAALFWIPAKSLSLIPLADSLLWAEMQMSLIV